MVPDAAFGAIFAGKLQFLESSLPRTRVPHISLVFREMWDTTNLDLLPANRDSEAEVRVKNIELSSVVPHISRKTSEIWGTRVRGRENS